MATRNLALRVAAENGCGWFVIAAVAGLVGGAVFDLGIAEAITWALCYGAAAGAIAGVVVLVKRWRHLR